MKHPWQVVVLFEEEKLNFDMEAHTLDGALSQATEQFKEKIGRLPHDNEFVKVERLAQTADT